MHTTRSFELKVGTFILIGIVLLFIIVFSIGDINLAKTGYNITVKFNFASGIGPSAPVRLAGVGVGQVQGVRVVYDQADRKTHAEIYAWVESTTKIEEDAKITINTLGLLGEKYLEILPGTPGKPILKANSVIWGEDPAMMEKVTDKLIGIADSVSVIVERLKNGEGTIGKLLVNDGLYDNLESFSSKLTKGQGTLGRLLGEDVIYDDLKSTAANFKAFSEDIRKHPWKLLSKPRGE